MLLSWHTGHWLHLSCSPCSRPWSSAPYLAPRARRCLLSGPPEFATFPPLCYLGTNGWAAHGHTHTHTYTHVGTHQHIAKHTHQHMCMKAHTHVSRLNHRFPELEVTILHFYFPTQRGEAAQSQSPSKWKQSWASSARSQAVSPALFVLHHTLAQPPASQALTQFHRQNHAEREGMGWAGIEPC